MLRLENEKGAIGMGEAAPIPWFGTETADDVAAVCQHLDEWGSIERFAAVPAELSCLRHAIASAKSELAKATLADTGPETSRSPVGVTGAAETASYLAVAALLPAGRAALQAMAPKSDAGFRVFKWKVGVADVADEIGLLDDLCAELPDGGKLRLDANGAWNSRQAQRWLERCADRPVEFVEQPIAANAKGAEDVLRGLANDFPTTLALDESLVRDGDIERWLENGWSGVFVVKPSLLADVDAALGALKRAKAEVVFSSALETGVGAKSALSAAFGWTGTRRALGFGVWPLFEDARFDGPHSAPFLHREEVDRLNPETIWNALS